MDKNKCPKSTLPNILSGKRWKKWKVTEMVTNPFFGEIFVTVFFCIFSTKFHSKNNSKIAALKRAKNRLWSQLFFIHTITKVHNQSQYIFP